MSTATASARENPRPTVPSKHSDYQRYMPAVQQLERHGYALVKIDAAVCAEIDAVNDLARRFFAQPFSVKHSYAAPTCVEGYREIGPEYSMVPERPDLTESFSFWYRNRHRPEIDAWNKTCPLHVAMRNTADTLCTIVDGLFTAMAETWSPGAPRLHFQEASYLQINYYEPAQHSRDLLQDPHEDGHLITLVRANQPGLEIKVDGQYVPAQIADDELLVMPSILLSLMSGNRVPPLYHQVRNSRRDVSRYSTMFFVNPELNQPLEPWVRNESNAGIDIIERANAAPQQFGLPTLVDGAAGQGHSYS